MDSVTDTFVFLNAWAFDVFGFLGARRGVAKRAGAALSVFFAFAFA